MVRKSEPPSRLERAAEFLPAVAGVVGGPVSSALATLGKGFIRDRATRHATENGERLEAEVERYLAENPEMVALVIGDDPAMSETLLRLYRSAVDSIDPAAIPLLVHLMGSYSGRRPDPTFRAVARVIQDAGQDELDHLARCVLEVAKECYVIDGTHVLVSWNHDGDGEFRARILGNHLFPEWSPLAAWMRSALGTAGLGVLLEGSDGEPQLRLELPALQVLVDVLQHHRIKVPDKSAVSDEERGTQDIET
ncbi:MAG: hypothetical protein GXP55_21395 [Deltaproteobacteria bacterium]|nr:hypothetical protein [Deltaproteobacteria bacterium]